MIDIILGIILLLLFLAASLYLYRAKKNGRQCMGCPYSKQCGRNACSCNSVKKVDDEEK